MKVEILFRLYTDEEISVNMLIIAFRFFLRGLATIVGGYPSQFFDKIIQD